jgi:hypothetical protein
VVAVRKSWVTTREFGPLAQLVRALPCQGRGRRFKSGTGRGSKFSRMCLRPIPILNVKV